MNKELIKFCCEYADGFEWINKHMIQTPFGKKDTFLTDKDFLDLLLNRAIQGINRKGYCNITYPTGGISICYPIEDSIGFEHIHHDDTTEGIRQTRIEAVDFVKGKESKCQHQS